MRGNTWVDRWIAEYGYQFVEDAVVRAITLKEIRDKAKKEVLHHSDGEESIKRKAKELGVKLL